VLAALLAGRHLVLEGPPGTGKSTLLRAIAQTGSQTFELVEGNAELTPARLVGHFDPALVLETGYDPKTWVDGPLARALREGSILYLEEINRVPEETLNLLVTVMSEAELTVPRLGRIDAHPDFRLVAAMNPFDAVGTARISAAIYDRVCRIAMQYQSEADEVAIATRHGNGDQDPPRDPCRLVGPRRRRPAAPRRRARPAPVAPPDRGRGRARRRAHRPVGPDPPPRVGRRDPGGDRDRLVAQDHGRARRRG
jgi:MoxR-like ATPase